MKCAKYLVLWGFLYSYTYANSSYEETLKEFMQAKEPINISNIVVDLATEAPCVVDNWDNVKKYACRCALVKEAEKTDPEIREGATIIGAAKQHDFCTDELLNQLREEEGLKNVSDTDFVNELYYRSKVIKKINLTADSQLYKTGNLTEEELKKMLVQAYNEKRLLHPAFQNASCLHIKNISAQGGYQTGRLFIVYSTCNKPSKFVVKELKKQKREIFDLSLASHAKELDAYIYPSYVKDFPVFVLPVAYLHYEAGSSNYYLSIMPEAPGIELLKLVKNYFKSPTEENRDIVRKAYSAIGRSLGHFHKKFMRKVIGKDEKGNKLTIPDPVLLSGLTIIHGDFHARNVFYDPKTDVVYLIDNEHAGKAVLAPTSIQSDLFNMTYVTSDLFIKKENKEEWIQLSFKPFIKSYLDAFGGNIVENIQEVKRIFTKPEASTLSVHISGVLQELIDQFDNNSVEKTVN